MQYWHNYIAYNYVYIFIGEHLKDDSFGNLNYDKRVPLIDDSGFILPERLANITLLLQ